MLFNSYTFLIFFAIVLCVSRKVCFWKGRKFFLLCMSYVFYMAWNPPFVILLWISTVGDWFFAKWMYRSENNQKRTIYLIASLVVNLGLLGYFKYATFVLDNFTGVIQALGFDWNHAPMSIVLPVGISFYTFQTLSYTMDVYRRQMKPSDSFLDYALYVTFFPQLVAGPIVRAKDFIPQCKEPTRVSRSQLGWGMTLFVVGMFNKVVIADAWMSGIVENGYQSVRLRAFWMHGRQLSALAHRYTVTLQDTLLARLGLRCVWGFLCRTIFVFLMQLLGFRISGKGGIFHYHLGYEIISIFLWAAIEKGHTEHIAIWH